MALVRIEDARDPRLASYVSLTSHQLRNRLEPERAILVCESAIAIRVALVQGVEPLSLLVGEARLESAAELIAELPAEVPVYVLPQDAMEELTGYRVTRGVLAEMRRPAVPSLAEVLAGARRVAVLEGLVDVTNVGAAFRSAAALGVDAVVVAPTCADPYSRRTVRVSMGTVFQVPWARAEGEWPQACVRELHEAGFACAAFALRDDALELGDPTIAAHERLALFFGTEGTGLTQPVVDACDLVVRIPMRHGVDSLNVAAASAVAFWEICR